MNWTRLHELRAEVGEDAFGEILDLFLSETDEKVAALRADPSFESLKADMHFLKGAALNLGFDDLVEKCQCAETLAREGRPGAVDLDAILACYDMCRSELSQARATLET